MFRLWIVVFEPTIKDDNGKFGYETIVVVIIVKGDNFGREIM